MRSPGRLSPSSNPQRFQSASQLSPGASSQRAPSKTSGDQTGHGQGAGSARSPGNLTSRVGHAPQIVISPDDEDAQGSGPCDLLAPVPDVHQDTGGAEPAKHEKKARYSFKKAALLVQGMLRFQKTVGQAPLRAGSAPPGIGTTPRRVSADTVVSSEISSSRSEQETDDDSTWRSSYRSSYRSSAREPSSTNAGAERGTHASQLDALGGSSTDLLSWPRVHAPGTTTSAPASTISSWFPFARPSAHLAKPADGSGAKLRWRRTRTKIIASVRLQKTDSHLLTPTSGSSREPAQAGAPSVANSSEQQGGQLWRKARNIVLAATRFKALKNIPEVEESSEEPLSRVGSGARGPAQATETLMDEAQAGELLAAHVACGPPLACRATGAVGSDPALGSSQTAARGKREILSPESSKSRMVAPLTKYIPSGIYLSRHKQSLLFCRRQSKRRCS
jgi:hypothetical protein